MTRTDEQRALVRAIVAALGEAIAIVEPGFYDSFNFTVTGNNLTHPRTLGFLSRILWTLPGVRFVDIDVRMNTAAGKFNPDLVATAENGQPMIIVDYESPNSSDARIPVKDVRPYLATGHSAAYLVITTLPNFDAPKWELRYYSRDGYNERHRDQRARLRSNPFQYWYTFYRRDLQDGVPRMGSVFFANISASGICLVDFSAIEYSGSS